MTLRARLRARCGAVLLAVLMAMVLSPTWCCCAMRQAVNTLGSRALGDSVAVLPPCCAARVTALADDGGLPPCPKGGSNGCPCKVLALKAVTGAPPVPSLAIFPPVTLAIAFVSTATPLWPTPAELVGEAIPWRHGPPWIDDDPVSTHIQLVI